MLSILFFAETKTCPDQLLPIDSMRRLIIPILLVLFNWFQPINNSIRSVIPSSPIDFAQLISSNQFRSLRWILHQIKFSFRRFHPIDPSDQSFRMMISRSNQSDWFHPVNASIRSMVLSNPLPWWFDSRIDCVRLIHLSILSFYPIASVQSLPFSIVPYTPHHQPRELIIYNTKKSPQNCLRECKKGMEGG